MTSATRLLISGRAVLYFVPLLIHRIAIALLRNSLLDGVLLLIIMIVVLLLAGEFLLVFLLLGFGGDKIVYIK